MSSSLVLPRANLDAEGAVVSAMLLDPDAIDRVLPIVRPADFYSDANRWICEGIFELASGGRRVDVVSVAEWLRNKSRLAEVGGAPYLAQLSDATPTVAHVEEHAIIVRDAARLRAAGALFAKLSAEARTAEIDDVGAWLSRCEADVYAATGVHQTDRVVHGTYGEIAQSAYAVARAAKDGGNVVGRTGFRNIDAHMGGFEPGDLWYIAGRPGMGKTSLALQMAEHASSAGIGVLVFSLEMSRVQLMLRAISRRARIPLRKLRSGNLTGEQWGDFATQVRDLQAVPIIVDDEPGLTPVVLRAKLRRYQRQLKQTHGDGCDVRLIVVDHVQLTHGAKAKYENRNVELTEVSASLKALAKEQGLCVVALSQLSKPAKGTKPKAPDLAELRESGALEQDADNVLMIHREDYYRDDHGEDDHIAEVHVRKGRNVGPALHKLYFEGRLTAFFELAGPEGEWADE